MCLQEFDINNYSDYSSPIQFTLAKFKFSMVLDWDISMAWDCPRPGFTHAGLAQLKQPYWPAHVNSIWDFMASHESNKGASRRLVSSKWIVYEMV